MAARRIEGEHQHPGSGRKLRFLGHYECRAIGVVYEADIVLGQKRTSLATGVITWGLHAFPPRRRVEQEIRETIDFTDIDKLLFKLGEA
jgi:hypothetical protein